MSKNDLFENMRISASVIGKDRDWDAVRAKNRVDSHSWKIDKKGECKGPYVSATRDDGTRGFVNPTTGDLYPARSYGCERETKPDYALSIAQGARLEGVEFGCNSFGFKFSSGYTIRVVLMPDGKQYVLSSGPSIDTVPMDKIA